MLCDQEGGLQIRERKGGAGGEEEEEAGRVHEEVKKESLRRQGGKGAKWAGTSKCTGSSKCAGSSKRAIKQYSIGGAIYQVVPE
mgnify:CR=1 FL=1